MIDWLIHPLKTKSVSWFAVCSLFICCLHVLYVIWYNLYMRVCVCVCVRACVCNFPFFIFCMLFIYMYISSIWRNKSWNPKKKIPLYIPLGSLYIPPKTVLHPVYSSTLSAALSIFPPPTTWLLQILWSLQLMWCLKHFKRCLKLV